MDKPNLELILVLAMVAVLFLFGLVVVTAFYRIWRREQKAKQATDDAARSPVNEPQGGDRT